MKRTKRAYDPARPNFKHFTREADVHDKTIGECILDFLLEFKINSSWSSDIRIKLSHNKDQEAFIQLTLREDGSLWHFIVKAIDTCANLFFQPLAIDPLNPKGKTWFGWADTGSVHPSIYKPHPIAYWETSPENFQAVWKWERGLPIAASTARVEALLHEFGGKLGSHLPDAYLRVPGVPNFSTFYEQWPVVRLRYNAFPIEDAREQALIEAEDLYMTE
jgi:RepB DNA-primase from phage plasmid